MQVAAPPETELLEYKSAAGAALVGRSLIFNWVGIGWCAGTIESAEKDGRRKSKVNGELLPGNFWVKYPADDSEALHRLRLSEYLTNLSGEGAAAEQWALLEPAPADAPAREEGTQAAEAAAGVEVEAGAAEAEGEATEGAEA